MATTRLVLFLQVLVIINAYPSEVDTARVRGAKEAEDTEVLHGVDPFKGVSFSSISDLGPAQSRIRREADPILGVLGGAIGSAVGGALEGAFNGARRGIKCEAYGGAYCT